MIMDLLKLNQVMALILATVKVVVSSLEQIKAASVSLDAATDLLITKAFTKAFPVSIKHQEHLLSPGRDTAASSVSPPQSYMTH